MKHVRPNNFARCLVKFFHEYLPTLRGMSAHTIRSYRDALVLYLRFTASRGLRHIVNLEFEDLTAERVGDFLADLERSRRSSIATRNARLAALHTFARFAASEYPEYLVELQRVLAVPFKRGAQRSTAGRLVDAKAKVLQAESSLTYKQAIDSVLAAEPDLKRAYAEGK
ncbi:MAG: site-specific integrase [Gammaproteobacteria bacterium]